ncbi:hypothetical protein FYJ26_03605 [Anaerococcus sp. WCA-380-WT-2B]|uniref:Uncharacterized protein n=1 Tax=Anaerococcus porci TaxID=2652269 RepID=A0A6N7VUW5_9FIRM|nr:SpaA isopeptide-forming pilin-related protein [Anaerococcus porci]MSS77499.1 hypothetical protein [Anaerococcus porci]
MKKALRKVMSFLMALFMVLQVMIPAFPSKAEELDPNTIKTIEDLKTDSDTNLSITISHKLNDLAKREEDENKFSIAVGISDKTRTFRLVNRDDISLYEKGHFSTIEEASKEYDRVKKDLNDQGLDLDISIIEEDEGFRIVDEKTYLDIKEGREPDKKYGKNYSYIDLKVLDNFDFENKGYTRFAEEKDKLFFNLDFYKYISPDPNFNLYEEDSEGNLKIKNKGDLLAVLTDDKVKKYDTDSLESDFSLLKQYKEEKSKAEEEKKTEEKKTEEDKKAEENTEKEKTEEDKKSEEKTEEKTEEDKKAEQEANTEKENKDQEEKSEEKKQEEPSNFDKADKELKDALANPKNGIKEIQDLLHELGEKYILTPDEEEKLMSANDKAIKDLVKKDQEENFRPNNLRVSNSFSDKEFQVNTSLQVMATSTWPIPTGWYFDLKIGPYLKADGTYSLKQLKDNSGKVVATPSYVEDGDNHYIRYTFVRSIKSNINLDINQSLAFDTDNIGNSDSIDVNISLAPKNNPEQDLLTKTVNLTDSSPVIGNTSYIINEQTGDETVYPYKLSWTSKQSIIDSNGNRSSSMFIDQNDLNVLWDIEVDTSPLAGTKGENLDFSKLNISLFSSAAQGLRNFKYKLSTSPINDYNSGYTTSDKEAELLMDNTSINKSELGDKLYIRVIAPIDSNQIHQAYSMGLRLNPDTNYIKAMVDKKLEEFRKIPTIFKWIEGLEQAQTYANVPFNLIETNIVANNAYQDKFTNENFFYDSTRTIVANRVTDNRVDWSAQDLIRLGEDEDLGLETPDFLLNGIGDKQDLSKTKVYFVPLVDGGYRRTTRVRDVLLDNGRYYPGTIVSYTYENQTGSRNDTYNMRTTIKEKKNDIFDPSSVLDRGGYIDLYTEKISQDELMNGFIAYMEYPYTIMRINRNFDMGLCFNSGTDDPTIKGKKGIFLDKNENPSGDFLISRLNENVKGNSNTSGYRLVPKLQEYGQYNRDGSKSQGQAMEDLMKRIFFYSEQVKKNYTSKTGEIMHRQVESSMLQRVIHHYTDGVDIRRDYFSNSSTYNSDSWKVDYTLGGPNISGTSKKEKQFEGSDQSRMTYDEHGNRFRMLKDNETRIGNYPPVSDLQIEYADDIIKLVEASYGNNSDWSEDKAKSVKLIFYSHTDPGKYQELISAHVVEPIEIDKFKEDGKTRLSGATFIFTNIYTGEVEKYKTNDQDSGKIYLKPGAYRVSELAPEGYEAIKPFRIVVERKEINPDDGPYLYKNLPSIHVNDGYKTEVKLSEVPTSADGRKLVELDNDKLKIKVTNIQDNLGKVEFTKKNKHTKLDGAEFTLTKLKATNLSEAQANQTDFDTKTDGSLLYQQKSTGSYGDFKFEQMPKGFYILEETSVPKGYEKAPKLILEAKETTDSAGKKKVEVSFVDKNIYNVKTNQNEIINETKKTSIKFRKVREDVLADPSHEHLGLSNAKFRLYSLRTIDNEFYLKEVYSDNTEKTNPPAALIDGQQAKNGGYFVFDNLSEGEYLLEELQAPKGYSKVDFFGWKLVVKENSKGNLESKLYKIPTEKDLDKDVEELEEVSLDDIIKSDENSGSTKAYQIGNDIRKIDINFAKYLASSDGVYNPILANEKLVDEIGQPVSFDLYKSDYYGTIIGDKINEKPIIQNIFKTNSEDRVFKEEKYDYQFEIHDLEFGGYYVLRENNPPKGYKKANDILLKVEAEAIADEGQMKVIVRDPNNNTKYGEHAIFEGVIDYKKEAKLGELYIKKTGDAIAPYKGKVGLRRAYFRLYTATDDFEIKKNAQGFAEEYIQKVSPGEAITKPNPDNPNEQIGKDPKELPKNQGIIIFDQLKPGKYVLEEYRGPAGYERDPNPWYILVRDDGTVLKSRQKINLTPELSRMVLNSPRLENTGLDLSNIESLSAVSSANLDSKFYSVDTKNANIDVDASAVNTDEGTRDIKLTIIPKIRTTIEDKTRPKKIHVVMLVDRDKDPSNSGFISSPTSLDGNINKFITDLRDTAQKYGSQVDISFIQYSGVSNQNKMLLDKVNLADYDYLGKEDYPMKLIRANNIVTEDTKIRDYLTAFGVSQRNTITDDSSYMLMVTRKKDFNSWVNSIMSNDASYDEKFVINLPSHNGNISNRFSEGGYNKYRQSEITSAFKGYESWVSHVDTLTNPDNTGAYTGYRDYMADKAISGIDHFDFKATNYWIGNQWVKNIAPYVQKDFFDSLLVEDNFVKKGPSTSIDESLLKNGQLQIRPDPHVSLISNSFNKESNGQEEPLSKVSANTADGIYRFDIPSPNNTANEGEEYVINYKLRLDDDASVNQDYLIHDILKWIPDKKNSSDFENLDTNNLIIRRNEKVNPPTPQGDINLKVDFTYSNQINGEEDKTQPSGKAGSIKLQVGDGLSWTDVADVKDAPYQGSLDFANLDPSRQYRVVYTRDEKNANEWATETVSVYPVDFKKVDPNTNQVTIEIANGNLTEIFNNDESGFRIPLRVSKVNSNKGTLTGSQFKARKIINGEKAPEYIDGKPTGNYTYPKYYNEEFDAVSEATGEPGDNYFRELTPGIYELEEIKTPDASYKIPKDKDGNPMKWYFKVYVNKDKSPRDADYMNIDFGFSHTFSESDDFNKAISDEEKQKLIGTTIKGLGVDDPVFNKYAKIVADDGRSYPARPDAPYKKIHDVQVTNYKNKTKLNFKKVDLNYNAISGAKFRLIKVKTNKDGTVQTSFFGNKPVEDTYEEDIIENEAVIHKKGDPIYKEEAISDKILGVEFNDIPEGTYILEEIAPAEGYKKNDGYITITFTENEQGKWKQVVKADSYPYKTDQNGNLSAITNAKSYIDLKFQKLDNKGEEVRAADFKLSEVDKKGEKIEGGYEKTIYSYDNSRFNFDNLGPGRYKLEETRILDRFQKPNPWFFTIKVKDKSTGELEIVSENKNDLSIREVTDKKDESDYQIINYEKTKFNFTKLKEDDTPLKDAVFSLKKVRDKIHDGDLASEDKTIGYLYDENGKFKGVYNGKYQEGTGVDSTSGATTAYYRKARSQTDGSVNFYDLTEGIYELEEIIIPEGYSSNSSQYRWIIEVKKGKNGLEVIYDKTREKSYYEKYDQAYDEKYKQNNFDKSDNLSLSPYGNKLINHKNTTDLKWKKVSDKAENPIKSETKFTLYKNSNDPDDLDKAKSGQAIAAPYEVVSSDGAFEITDLSKGVYTLAETSPPTGYKKMDRYIVIQIKEDGNNHLQKTFYELKLNDNGQYEIVGNFADFDYILANIPRIGKPSLRKDKDSDFWIRNFEKDYFVFSKISLNGRPRPNNYDNIKTGYLKLKLSPADDNTNKNAKTYTKEVNLAGDPNLNIYKFEVDDISEGTYILEELMAPDGYQKTLKKYKIKFTRENGSFTAMLVAVLNEDGSILVDKQNRPIDETGDVISTLPPLTPLRGVEVNGPLKIVNKKIGIEFTKVDKQTDKPLANVEFVLERQDDSAKDYYPVTRNLDLIMTEKETGKRYIIKNGEKVYETSYNRLDDYKLKSNIDGKFKLENLKDGYYRIMETKVPDGYMKPQGSVKEFRVIDDDIEILTQHGYQKITDENKTRLTKIVNYKPGKGRFSINKTNEEGKKLQGVKFTLTSIDGTSFVQTTNSEGKAEFTDLPNGFYWLMETSTLDGYMLDKQKKPVLIGDQSWTVPDKPINPEDVSDRLIFDGKQASVKSVGGKSESEQVVYPNEGEAIFAQFRFKLREGEMVKPGDTFTVNFSDNVDLDGIVKDNDGVGKTDSSFLDMMSPSGKIAKAKINDDRKSITYTFTNFVENYKPEDMQMFIQLYPDRIKIDHTQDFPIRVTIGNPRYAKADQIFTDNIRVDYSVMLDGQGTRSYANPTTDAWMYNLRVDPKEKTFTAVVYYNLWNKSLYNKNLTFTTNQPIDANSLSVRIYKKTGRGFAQNWRNGYLPQSNAVDFDNRSDLRFIGDGFTTHYVPVYDQWNRLLGYNPNETKLLTFPEEYFNARGDEDSTYVLEIKGKLSDSSKATSLLSSVNYSHREYYCLDAYGRKTTSCPRWTHYTDYTGEAHSWSKFYVPGASGEGKLEFNFVNYKNVIEYTKIDGGVISNVNTDNPTGETSHKPDLDVLGVLEGAEFELRKDGVKVEGSERKSDVYGKFSWKGLAEGSYEVWETKAPHGYKLPEKRVSSFKVDKDGHFIDILDNKQIIANYKRADLKLKKLDQDGNPLEGAQFLLEGKDVEGYDDRTLKSDSKGQVTFEDLAYGKYTLKEMKAPDGYNKTDKTWEIEVTRDGKILWTNSFDDSLEIKDATVTNLQGQSSANLDSKIVGINKDKKVFRQYNLVKLNGTEKDIRIRADSGVKLNDSNTQVRVIPVNNTSTLDAPTVIDKNANFKLAYDKNTINLVIEENKGKEDTPEGSSSEESSTNPQRTYLVIVDMPYNKDGKVGAGLAYGVLEASGFKTTESIDKYVAYDSSISQGQDKHNPGFANDKYLLRNQYDMTLVLENKKNPDIYFEKVDSTNKETKLQGAEFVLQKKIGETYLTITKEGKEVDPTNMNDKAWTATSDDKGRFEFKSIPDGDYQVKEVKAPRGYANLKPIAYKFKVQNGKIYKEDLEGRLEDKELENSDENREQIENKKAVYPSTGGPGVWIGFTIIGLALMILAVLSYSKKKEKLS